MAIVGIIVFVALGVGIVLLGIRWTRPRPTAPDLQRADELQTQDRADAKTVREKVFAYVTMYGPKR